MLVACTAYQDGKKLADIQPEQIHEYVNRPECFVWVALVDSTQEELRAMQQEFNLHELAVEDAMHGHQRPKVEEYGDSLFVVLHTIEKLGVELHVGEVDVFAGRNYVLSVRNRTAKGFTEVRERCEREPHLLKYGSGFVLYALMDAVVDRYFPMLDTLEDELERVEAHMFDETPNAGRTNVQALYALKRKLTVLKHAVAPLLEGLSKLYGGRVPSLCTGTQDYYRDVYDHLFRINQSIDGLRDNVVTAVSVNLSLITLSDNATTKQLAAYAALVAIPTLIAGIYGMNFENMPELKWVWGYPVTLIVMVLLDFLVYRHFHKLKWI